MTDVHHVLKGSSDILYFGKPLAFEVRSDFYRVVEQVIRTILGTDGLWFVGRAPETNGIQWILGGG